MAQDGNSPAHRHWLAKTYLGSRGGWKALGVLSGAFPRGCVTQDPSPGLSLLREVNKAEKNWHMARAPEDQTLAV